jgi:hypothetical protein
MREGSIPTFLGIKHFHSAWVDDSVSFYDSYASNCVNFNVTAFSDCAIKGVYLIDLNVV